MAALTLKHASLIVDKAIEKARAMNIPALGVIVLDAAGHTIAYKREDGATMFREDIARGKAWGAVAMGCSSRSLGKKAQSNPNFMITLAATAEGKFLPQVGGVLIRDASGNILGAAGASGASGDQDEACCIFGIEQAGLVADAAE